MDELGPIAICWIMVSLFGCAAEGTPTVEMDVDVRDANIDSDSDVPTDSVSDAEVRSMDGSFRDSALNSDSGGEGSDMTNHHEVSGDLAERLDCTDVCSRAGMHCDGQYEHFIAGEVGGLAEYAGGTQTGLDCSERPAVEITDPGTGDMAALVSYVCYCR